MNGQIRKKKIITTVAAVCLLFVYIMIFCFSSESAEESSALSRAVMDFLVDMYYKLMGGGGEVVVVDPQAVPLEKIIRKAAHFAEYMAVGFLSFGIAVLWIKKLWYGVGLVMLQLLISGALDELHQYFVPGRYASVKDVMLDTAGGMAGILIILLGKGYLFLWNYLKQFKRKKD